jgi:hypothetical protein
MIKLFQKLLKESILYQLDYDKVRIPPFFFCVENLKSSRG